MNDRTSGSPGLQVGEVRFLTAQPLAGERAQSLAGDFARELDAAVAEAQPAVGTLRIRELVIDARGGELRDGPALRRLALAAARRILDQAPE